ncbi:MAG TPA: asparagine synthase (glutamine-hydrolyzing), partial [Candidatus Limnocylindrales bacterium]|nr:asparagine synthase (glutamine-hydrolyzing) [Candidatus Limnocylindrales bacterium]
MCGIAGQYRSDGGASESEVRRMLSAIEHRGPDATAVADEGAAVLGHHRLSIIDLSDAASQPMVDASGRYVMTYNGEIFNYVELRAELESEGVAFRSASDSEVLLAAFANWGDDAYNRLNGMFAFAIFDRTTRTLTCVRDRLGVKPLVYVWDGVTFSFASEHKALVASGCASGDPSPDAVYEYIARGYTTGGRSFYDDIAALEPGSMLRVNADGLAVRHWWQPSLELDERPSFAEWTERVAELVDDSVRIRLRSDVEVGGHLSGGLDSSAIVAAGARHEPGIQTFTGAFLDDPESDERRYSRAVNERFGLRGREVEISVDELGGTFDRLLWHLDEPIAGPGAFPQLLVCDLA